MRHNKEEKRHKESGKVTNFERDLKYKFNDLKISDISLPTGKYREAAESIYCSLDYKEPYFAGKLRSSHA